MSIKVTAQLQETKGSTFIGYVALPLDEIYVPKNDTSGENNPTRFRMNFGNVNLLAESFRKGGQDLSLKLPVVEKLPKPIKRNGMIYTYRLVCGSHRHAAGIQAKMQSLTFSIFEFDNDCSKLKFQLEENDHAPSYQATAQDIANTLVYAVHKSFCENNEESMKEFASGLNKVHGNTLNKAIQIAIRDTNGYQDYHVYTPKDVEEFADRNEYVIAGRKDEARQRSGWFVKEGYEHEYITNALKKFSETELPSYFVGHTKSPTERKSLDEKRAGMIMEFQKLEKALDRVYEYKQEHNRYPWDLIGFLPQNNSFDNRETEIIKL